MREESRGNFKIVFVGGTGQMVLHYYLQLYLLGEIAHPFDAVVIDTDDIYGSVRTMQSFIAELQYGTQESEALGVEIPTIRSVRVTPQRADSTLQALTGRRDVRDVDSHPARAFFDSDTLRQDLMQGLYARPALSSVISQEVLKDPSLRPKANTKLVVVGSVLGGTGGGLTAPVMDAIRLRVEKESIEKVQTRAVLFSEYFTPDAGIIEGDVVRFKSNQTFVLRAIREALDNVHSFHIVGGPGASNSFKRQPDDEKKGEYIPWPKDDSNPFWQGAQALEHLLTETTRNNQVEFHKREVEQFEPPVSLARSQLKLAQRLSLVSRLINKNTVIRMSSDPWARLIWSDALIGLVAHYWSIAAKEEGGKDKVKDFPRKVQGSLQALWRGQGDRPGLEKVFPRLTKLHGVRPGNISRIPWPRIDEERRHKTLFQGTGNAARRAAAALLFWSLREGV